MLLFLFLVVFVVLLVLLELLVVLLLDHRVRLRPSGQFRCCPLILLLFTLSPDVTESGRGTRPHLAVSH